MTDYPRLCRLLLTSLESALPGIPPGEDRHLAEDAIADTRHALGMPPLPEEPGIDLGALNALASRP